MSESPEKEVEAGVENGEDHPDGGDVQDMPEVEKDDLNGAHSDEEEKADKEVEGSPSPRARGSASPRDASPSAVSRSRSPVRFIFSISSSSGVPLCLE